ncbi:MAG: hypothetical protein ACHREM_08020, partial [Polyangiales bacterium]
TITELAGVDPKGCAVVRVEADKKTYYWRVRDMSRGYAFGSVVGSGEGTPGDYDQACGRKGVTGDWGSLKVGDSVILGRHRKYEGDDDWASDMDAFVGKIATVTKLDSVDGPGCPYIRVDVDKGAWAWRLRDLRRPGGGLGTSVAASPDMPSGTIWSSGIWMVDRSADGDSAHVWTSAGTTAIELRTGSNGWWRIRKGSSEKVVFPDGTTKSQAFVEHPWSGSPTGTWLKVPKSWSMTKEGYTTRIHVDGNSFTVTLSDGKTITGDASGTIWYLGKAM